MKILRPLLLLAAAAALAFWLWTIFFPDEEQLIRKHLVATARAASFSSNEGALARIGNIAELSECFTPDVELKFDVPRQGQFEVSGRDEILAVAARVRDSGRTVTVEFLDVTVQVGDDRQVASAVLTARAKVPGEDNFSVQEMKFFLKKINGRWLINRVETVKTLSTMQRYDLAQAP